MPSPPGFAATLIGLPAKLARRIVRYRGSRGSANDPQQSGAAKGNPMPKESNGRSSICENLKSLSASTYDRQLRFCSALEILPEQTRLIYLLHSRDGQDFPAIASLMGITINQVQLELARALKLLCEAIDEE